MILQQGNPGKRKPFAHAEQPASKPMIPVGLQGPRGKHIVMLHNRQHGDSPRSRCTEKAPRTKYDFRLAANGCVKKVLLTGLREMENKHGVVVSADA